MTAKGKGELGKEERFECSCEVSVGRPTTAARPMRTVKGSEQEAEELTSVGSGG